jgi:Uncharacterised nucleotidyltransferase
MKPAKSIVVEPAVTPPETVRSRAAYDPSLGAEVALLIRCARTFVDADTRDEISALIHGGINWDYLLQLANYHGVVGLLTRTLNTSCDSGVPSDVLNRLKDQARESAQRNLNMTRSLLKIVDLFGSQSIPLLPFKGPLLAATAYGNLALREFCDLDVLVREQDVLRATAALTENGYKLELPPDESRPMPKLIKSKKDFRFVSDDQRVVVELHWRLAGRHFYFPYGLDQLWDRLERISVSGTSVLNIPPEDLLVILCAHGSKHLWGRLLWVCDIGELIRSNPKIDWQRTMRNARESGGQRMVLLGLHLANTLLGSELPAEIMTAIKADRIVELLAADLLREAFPASALITGQVEHHSHALYPFFIRMRERLRDKARLSFQFVKTNLSAAVTPTGVDQEFFALPSSVSFLYYFLRPLRLIGRSASQRSRR